MNNTNCVTRYSSQLEKARMVERKETTTVNCAQLGGGEFVREAGLEATSQQQKLPSFTSLDCWLHTAKEGKEEEEKKKEEEQQLQGHINSGDDERNISLGVETGRFQIKATEQYVLNKGLNKETKGSTSGVQEGFILPNMSNETAALVSPCNLPKKQVAGPGYHHSMNENTADCLEDNNEMHMKRDVNCIENMLNKRRRVSNESITKKAYEDRDKPIKSLSSTSSGSYENIRKEMDAIPFNIQEAGKYTNSKPHLSAAALQCATLAASELQSELKATEELLNSAARRRYMNYWTPQGAIMSGEGTQGQLFPGNTKQVMENPRQNNDDRPSVHVNMTDDAVSWLKNTFQGVLKPTNPVASNNSNNNNNSSGMETTLTANIVQQIVKRLATMESELTELRCKNSALEREREILLMENESLRKVLEEWKKGGRPV